MKEKREALQGKSGGWLVYTARRRSANKKGDSAEWWRWAVAVVFGWMRGHGCAWPAVAADQQGRRRRSAAAPWRGERRQQVLGSVMEREEERGCAAVLERERLIRLRFG